jgi:hypothetical protein
MHEIMIQDGMQAINRQSQGGVEGEAAEGMLEEEGV